MRGFSCVKNWQDHIWFWPADVGRDDHVALREPVDRREDGLRHDRAGGRLVPGERILLLPLLALGDPRGVVGLVHLRQQVAKHGLDVAHAREVAAHALGDRRRVDVDVHDLRVRGELAHLAGHAVVEARADREQHVAFVESLVGGDQAVHADHVQRERVALREHAEAHERRRHRDVRLVRELGELLHRVGAADAAAGVDERPVARVDELREAREHLRVPLVGGLVADAVELLGERDGGLADLNVLREVHEHRAGLAGRRDVERLDDDARQVVHVAHEVVVLRDRARDAAGVGFLEGVVADGQGGNLAGERDHRDAVHVGGREAGDDVRGAGAGRDDADARLPGGARVGVGHVGAALLVAGQDQVQLLGLGELVEDVEDRPAGIREDRLHAQAFEPLDDDARARAGLHTGLRGRCGAAGIRLGFGFHGFGSVRLRVENATGY